jgi:hypothetical protein
MNLPYIRYFNLSLSDQIVMKYNYVDFCTIQSILCCRDVYIKHVGVFLLFLYMQGKPFIDGIMILFSN